jgi:hypothetical protein
MGADRNSGNAGINISIFPAWQEYSGAGMRNLRPAVSGFPNRSVMTGVEIGKINL